MTGATLGGKALIDRLISNLLMMDRGLAGLYGKPFSPQVQVLVTSMQRQILFLNFQKSERLI